MSDNQISAQARLSRTLQDARAMVWELDLRTGTLSHETPVQLFGARPLPLPLPLHQALRLIHPQDRQEVVARARAAVAHCSSYVQQFRMSFASAGAAPGPPVWVEHHGTVFCEVPGRASCLFGTMIDISAHKQAMDVLAGADHRKDEFFATLAHELRNPLTAIDAAAQLMRSVTLKPDQTTNCVDMIHRQSLQLVRLVDDLLDISRVVRNRLEIKRELTDLRDAIKTAAEAIGEQVRQHHHHMALLQPEERLALQGDSVRLSQLFGNLLGNAVKYTPDNGHINVSVQHIGDWAVVTVSDDGLGIPVEHLTHIFKPFYQVDSSLGRAQGGLGIGLALVQRITQLHGGSVSAFSEGPGQGSSFTVRLPLMVTSTEVPPASSRTLLKRSARSLRVLVADDNADVAQTLCLTLQMCGHNVRVALDGEEALRIAELFHPHAALLDVAMPKRAGDEVAREIRARPWASKNRTLLVALSGWNARDLQGRIDMSAFDSQMVKPLDIDAVRQLLDRPRQRSNGGARRSAADTAGSHS